MKHFVYYSKSAPTRGNFGTDLMKAGRIDIALQFVIATLFTSNSIRDDVIIHLVFDGKPDPTKHLEIKANPEVHISKKDVLGLIKRLLYKYRKGEKHEPYPGQFIEKKSLKKVLEDLALENEIYILDGKGVDNRSIKYSDNVVFVLGDQDGLEKRDVKDLKKKYTLISVGPITLFASQTAVIVHNELDRK